MGAKFGYGHSLNRGVPARGLTPLMADMLAGAGLAPRQIGAAADFTRDEYWSGGSRYALENWPGWSYSRTGTRYSDSADGSLTSFAANVPRRTDKGLAVDAGATNVLTYSQDFSNAAWVGSSAGTGSDPVVTANAGVAPDGTMTADQIVFDRGAGDTSSDSSTMTQAPTTSAGTYTGGLWLKAATGDDVGKEILLRHVYVGAFTVLTLTADWVRHSVTETQFANNFQILNRGTYSTGNSVSLLAWQAQLVSGSVAVPDIPTTSASASAGADVASVDLGVSGGLWTNLGNLDPSNGFTIVCNFNLPYIPTNQPYVFSVGTDVSNRIGFYINSIGNIRTWGIGGGASYTTSLGAALLGSNKVALAFEPGVELRGSANGGAGVGDLSGSTPTSYTSLIFGARHGQAPIGNMYIERNAVIEGALTDAQLQVLST